ncbi:MAG: chemotaxis signal transduction protein, partial [Armatimonadetes bacterium]|nr:chemotaxis signal transduction protein [Armatimonadota bacterium]
METDPASLSLLTFGLHGSEYAVNADAVREIVWLPELTPIAEAPGYVVGVLNLRGVIVP